MLDELPELPRWVPVDKYGYSIPFVLVVVGLWLGYFVSGGVVGFESLTVYGKIGVLVVVALSVLSFALAGWVYAHIDTSWWVFRKADVRGSEGEITIGEDE